MLSRQRAILRLIQNEGGSVNRLRLVKLAFLLSRETEAPRTGVYEFVPYKRGPFSFTLYHDLRALERDGWVTESKHDITTAETPDLEVAFLDKEFLAMIDRVSQAKHRPSRLPEYTADTLSDQGLKFAKTWIAPAPLQPPCLPVALSPSHTPSTPVPPSQSPVPPSADRGVGCPGLGVGVRLQNAMLFGRNELLFASWPPADNLSQG